MNDLTFRRVDLGDERPAPEGKAETPSRAAALGPVVLRYVEIARRGKWLIAGSVAVFLALGLIVTLMLTPKYTASAVLEIQREGDRVVNVQGVEPEAAPMDQEFYQTQYGLLHSDTLAERVATELRLYDDPTFFEMFGESDVAAKLREASGRPDAKTRNERIRTASEVLLKHVGINPQRLSRLVEVTFTSPNPQLSARVVNNWTKLFIKTSLDRRYDATSYARQFLEDRLNQLRTKLEESERAAVNYASKYRIINIPSASTSNQNGVVEVERPLVADDLATLNQALNDATAARIAAQSRLTAAGGSTAEALTNDAISQMRSHRAELAAQRAKMLAQFEPGYPPAQALADQIAETDRSIAREEARIRDVLRTNYQNAAQRESALRSRVRSLENDMLDLRGRTIQYNIYQREVDTNRQLYDALLQRYKEIGVAGGVGVNNISVVDPAEVPEKPSSPKVLLNLLLSIMAGLTVGGVLAVILHQTDEAFSDPRLLESRLGLPLLGTIPNANGDDLKEQLDDPKSPLFEAYVSTRTSLAFSTDHGLPRSLSITSTRSGEGKSTTALALALAIARTSKRVILVDGDMRSPSQHVRLGLDNTIGLSNYLSGDDDLDGIVQHVGASLDFISAGASPPNAAELLASTRLDKLLKDLLTRYDHVVFDAPPVLGLADAPQIAHAVEGSIFVVESHKTRATMAQVAIGRLNDAQARVIGALLTRFDAGRANYGYGYDYGYGYGQSKAETA